MFVVACNNLHALSITAKFFPSPKPGKAHGSGACPPNTLLMETTEHITLCLARIFQQSTDTHQVPIALKNDK